MNVQIDRRFKSLIPPLQAAELVALETSILAEGVRDALVLWGDFLLDGHHRYAICQKYGLKYPTTRIDLLDAAAAKVWVIRNQFARRNLTPFQRAELAIKLEPLIRKKAKANERRGGGSGPSGRQKSDNPVDTKKELATEAGVSHDTIHKAQYIAKHADDEVQEKLRRGESTINREYTRAKREEQKVDNESKGRSRPPKGKYSVVVIDPPWPMKKIERDCRPNQTEQLDYPTMTEDELAAFSLPATDNCHLFLWTTQKFLPMALRLLPQWNFRYVCTLVWHKPGGFQPVGLPQYNCEFCLYARKGTPIFRSTKAFSTCFQADRGKHSEKPAEFYAMIEKATTGPRLDMFSRRAIKGYKAWGNES